MIYTTQDIDTLSERLDTDNIAYDRLTDGLMKKMDECGSVMFIGMYHSYIIIDNSEPKYFDLSRVQVGRAILDLNSVHKHFLLFTIKDNHDNVLDNYNDLSTVFYHLNPEIKTYNASEERMIEQGRIKVHK